MDTRTSRPTSMASSRWRWCAVRARWWTALALCVGAVNAPAAGPAPDAPSASDARAPARVYTRATVRDLPTAGAEPALVRLKIAPRGQLPFSTLTFRVDDRRLLDGIALGDEVGFIAERRPGGNTLTALRKVTPCVRFQNCPEITD